MTSQVFYRKWRPQSLADVVGQEAVTRTLTNALATGRTAHAYLFCGPRGTGKTSTGRILAKAMNCLTTGGKGEPCNTCAMCQGITEGRAMDLIEIDAASNRGIDEIRSLREKVRYAPAEAQYKVYIIDEVHMLTEPAFNALLKTLEEPPPNTIFILATTDAHKVPATIISRCQRFDFHRLSPQAIVARLRQVCDAEGIQAAPELLRAVARHAGGSLRDAENLLEQLAVSYGTELKLEQVRELFGMGNDQRVRDLAKLVLAKNVPGGLAAFSAATLEGIDLRQLHRSLVEWLRAALLAKAGATDALDLDADAAADIKALAGATTVEEIARALKLFSQADVRADVQSPLPLELALVEFSQPPAAVAATPRAQQPSPAPRPPPAARSAAAPMDRGAAPFAAPARPVAPPASRVPAMDAANAGDAPAARPRPAAPPASQVAFPPGVPSGMTPQEHLKANWAALLREDHIPPQFHKNPGVYYVRIYARPATVEDGCITLEFNKAIYKEHVEKLENRKEVEKLFEYLLAKPYRLKCTLAAPAAATPQRQTAPGTPQPRQPAPGGHMVQALKDMGARVVTTSTPEKTQGDAPPAAREESQ